MPWRGPEVPNEFPTLGGIVADWIEARCAVPDRDQVGEPFVVTDEQLHFLYRHYRINPDATYDAGRKLWRNAFYYERGSQICRPQGWGKGPFSGAITCAEAAGPVVFDGWDANGEPVGRPWSTPIIQITAMSEDQTDNVWMALLPMIQLGDFDADIPETGQLRIYLPHGGLIEPVTSSARSRLGQRVTFLVQDQTESWTTTNGGRALADNQRRNLAKMSGRWLSTCNAWDPTEDSVAQYSSEREAPQGGVYQDDIEPPEGLSIRNKAERRKALKYVYGDAWWVDLDRVDSEIRSLLDRDAAQAERFFLNRKNASEAKAFNGEKWDKLATDYRPEHGALIVVGVDGARFDDALAMIATEIETGYQWPLGIWERPNGAPDDYEHSFDEADGALREADDLYDIWRVYIDPGSTTGNITPLMEKWEGDRGGKSVRGGVAEWLMHRPRQTGEAVATYTAAINTGNISHDGDEVFTRHIKNAVRWKVSAKDEDGRNLYTIGKDRAGSPHKIDAAAAAVISWEARGDAIADGAGKEPTSTVYIQGM